MAEFMKTLLWLSAAGAALGLILFAALRLCGGRLSRAFAYYMWLAVLLRLILPVASPLPADIFAAGAQKASLPAAQTAQTSAAETAAAAPQTPAEAAAPETQPGAAERRRRRPASAVGRPVLGMGGGCGGERGLVRAVVREILQRADARGLRSL
jgi:beta-lactamase regulating signal transducer with metallopeptidase domain